jgi:hypothetical protein
MKMCFLDLGGGGFNKKVGLRVIAEKMESMLYLSVGNNPYPQDVS